METYFRINHDTNVEKYMIDLMWVTTCLIYSNFTYYRSIKYNKFNLVITSINKFCTF